MKKIFLLLILLISVICVYPQANPNVFYVGTAKTDITPTEPVHLAGYGWINSDRIADHVHDQLYCRVTAIKSQRKHLILLSSDLIGFHGQSKFIQDELVKKFPLNAEDIFITSIHTHSGPITTLNKEYKSTGNYRYTKQLLKLVIDTVSKALKEMKPAEIRVNKGYSPIGINRRVMKLDPSEWPEDGGLMKMGRNPHGIVDNEVLVLKITGTKSNFSCCLFDYACHNRTQDRRSKIISGDFMGISEQLIEKILEKGMIASAFAGASGEIDPIYVLNGFNQEPGWVPETELLGRLLGQEVIRTYRKAEEKIGFSQIQSKLVNLKLPRRKKGEYVSDPNLPKASVNITVASFGEIAFIGLGCELSVKLGLKIKQASPFKYNFVITHCNGASGYLSPKEYYLEKGYEVSTSQFGPESGEMVIKETLKLLYDQYKN